MNSQVSLNSSLLGIKSPSSLTFGGSSPNSGLNLINLTRAEEIIFKSQEILGSRPVKLATAGYSAAPKGYEEPTRLFLSALIDELSPVNVGLITSPTADKGSIDAISSMAAQGKNIPLLYVTANDYVSYINPDNFPDNMDKITYKKMPKFVFPDAAEYSKATAEGSNSLLVTGGRDTTVSDFVNAIKKDKQDCHLG